MSMIYVKGLRFSFLQICEIQNSDWDVTFLLYPCSYFLMHSIYSLCLFILILLT